MKKKSKYNENKKKYNFKLGTFQEAKYKEVKDLETGKVRWDLDLPEIDPETLPTVSIVTITKNRVNMCPIMLYNWSQTKYPKEKIEWVIVDDSATDELRQYVSHDERIRYYHTEPFDSIAVKRNYACELARNEYLAFMDDDDYYFPDHVLVKVQVLMANKRQGVHSMPLPVYDAITKESWIFDWTKNGKKITNGIAEATVMVKKSYWEKHPFKSNMENGGAEGASLVGRRFYDWINVHFLFNMISITHKKNVTNESRRLDIGHDKTKVGSFRDVFPDTFLHIIDSIEY